MKNLEVKERQTTKVLYLMPEAEELQADKHKEGTE